MIYPVLEVYESLCLRGVLPCVDFMYFTMGNVADQGPRLPIGCVCGHHGKSGHVGSLPEIPILCSIILK